MKQAVLGAVKPEVLLWNSFLPLMIFGSWQTAFWCITATFRCVWVMSNAHVEVHCSNWLQTSPNTMAQWNPHNCSICEEQTFSQTSLVPVLSCILHHVNEYHKQDWIWSPTNSEKVFDFQPRTIRFLDDQSESCVHIFLAHSTGSSPPLQGSLVGRVLSFLHVRINVD